MIVVLVVVIPANAAPTPSKGVVYERRRPETGTLYNVVRDNLQTLYAVEEGFASPLPAFVRDEFERYLDCGLFDRMKVQKLKALGKDLADIRLL